MKQEIKTTEAIFPMPVLMISTFNEDGSVDVMNAAWGTMLDRDKVALNLTETHKTVENIKARKGFVVHIADAKHVVEADYFGIASGNTEKEKFAKSGMTFTKNGASSGRGSTTPPALLYSPAFRSSRRCAHRLFLC